MSNEYRYAQIIKHALAYYLKRENADPKDLIVEEHLYKKQCKYVEFLKQRYNIKEVKVNDYR